MGKYGPEKISIFPHFLRSEFRRAPVKDWWSLQYLRNIVFSRAIFGKVIPFILQKIDRAEHTFFNANSKWHSTGLSFVFNGIGYCRKSEAHPSDITKAHSVTWNAVCVHLFIELFDFSIQIVGTAGKVKRILLTLAKLIVLLGMLYLFICSLSLLTSAFRMLGGKKAGKNPS